MTKFATRNLHSLYELRNLENKHKYNPLVSTETVRHWVGLYTLLSHPGIPGVTLCSCTGSYAAAAVAAAAAATGGRRFLSTQ